MTSADEPGAGLARFFAGAGHVFSHVFFSAYAVVVVDMAARGEFGGNYATLLPLMGFGLFLYGLCAIPAGLLGDRWSGPGMMVVFFLGSGAASLFAGVSGSRTELWIALSLIGMFGSIYHPVGIAWLVRNPARRGRAMGMNGMVGNATVGLTPPLAGILIDTFSWRAAFLVPGALSLALGVMLIFCIATGRTRATPGKTGFTEIKSSPGEIRHAILLLAVVAICTGVFFNATFTIMPKFVADSIPGLAEGGMTRIGFAVAPIYLVGALAQICGGYLSDRYSVKWIYVSCWGMVLLTLLPLSMLVGPVAVPFALLAISFNVMSLPPENVMYARFSPPAWRGTFYGIKFVLAFGVGWPAVEAAGWLYGRAGNFTELFLALTAVAALALAAALALPKTPMHVIPQPA